MALQVFVNFDGNCREAVEFYAKVFNTQKPEFMTFGSMPPDPEMVLDEKDKNRIMYTDLNIHDTTVMFCDNMSGMPFVNGNNIALTIVTKDENEIRRLFDELGAGGEVDMELQETFWSNLFGMVTDKFGISWQLSHDSGKEYGKS